MPREIEAKFRVSSHEFVRTRLKELKATCLGSVLETNHILDRPDGSLRGQGCALRVRVAEPLASDPPPSLGAESNPPESPLGKGGGQSGTPDSPFEVVPGGPEPPASACATSGQVVTLTFKGPREPGPLKSREEIELEVADASAMLQLLERLGYQTILSYQKDRESWSLDDCRIELDEPPHIGLFVEIEGPHECAIRNAQQRLALAQDSLISSSYVRLLMDHCRENNLSPLDLKLRSRA